jgi:hypothetical protein
VRLAVRQPAKQLEPTGMQILDDGSQVQHGPEKRFHGAVAHLRLPKTLPRLTQEQAEVLAIVISDGISHPAADRGGQGATQLSIATDRAASLPRDSSETLALLLSRGLVAGSRTASPPPDVSVWSRPARRMGGLSWTTRSGTNRDRC